MDEEQKKLVEELLTSEESMGFAKQLFFGKFESTYILPFPQPNQEEKIYTQTLLGKLKEFADEFIDPDKIDRKASIPKEVIKGLGQLGILGMTVPKEFGGLEMSQNAYCQVIEEIASRCGATSVFTNAHQSIGLKGILLFGSEDQKKKFLPSLATGKKIAAFSLTEPNAGSDAAGIETKAVYHPRKKTYTISGKKQWTTNGSIANVITLMAKTEINTPTGKEKKVTAFLIEPDMEGFTITNPGLEKVGIRGTKTTNIELNELEVPEENILGPLGGGLKVCLTCLDYGRTTFGAMCTGAAKYALQRAIEHSITRYQFNRPLASFSLVKKKIASMSALVFAMDATTYLTAGLIDLGIKDVMLEAAILKVFASDALWDILYDTMQIFGGRSFFTTEPFERMMRDARLNMIGEGSNEVLRAFISLAGMREVGIELKGVATASKRPLQHGLKILSFSMNFLKRIRSPKIRYRSSELKNEFQALSQEIRDFGFKILPLLGKYKENIVEQQLILNRITNIAIALYTLAAVLSKMDFLLSQTSKDASFKLKKEIATGKLYCSMAFQKIRMNKKGLEKNLDKEYLSLSELITGLE